eukprot:768056-Hanusia_phi.AAC.8
MAESLLALPPGVLRLLLSSPLPPSPHAYLSTAFYPHPLLQQLLPTPARRLSPWWEGEGASEDGHLTGAERGHGEKKEGGVD